MLRQTTILLALLALVALAAPAGGRTLLRSHDEETQAAREAAQLAAQQAELAKLIASGKDDIADQVGERGPACQALAPAA